MKEGFRPLILPAGRHQDNCVVIVQAGKFMHPPGINDRAFFHFCKEPVTDNGIAGRLGESRAIRMDTMNASQQVETYRGCIPLEKI